MFLFKIQVEGVGVLGTVFFIVKERYRVSLLKDGSSTCTCYNGTIQAGRKEDAKCKHVLECKRLLKAIRRG